MSEKEQAGPKWGPYKPTKWNTSDDKANFAEQFKAFVESGFDKRLFTQEFYKRLSLTFGHIAHFNSSGFYDVWFSSSLKRYEFLKHASMYMPVGDPEYTYSDVERDIVRWVRESSLVEQYRKKVSLDVEAAERAELARLKKKYEGGGS